MISASCGSGRKTQIFTGNLPKFIKNTIFEVMSNDIYSLNVFSNGEKIVSL